MTELEKLLLKTVLANGDIEDASPCEEHHNCLTLHLRIDGAKAAKPRRRKTKVSTDPPLEKDVEYSPALVEEVSATLGYTVEIYRDLDTGWTCAKHKDATPIAQHDKLGELVKILKGMK